MPGDRLTRSSACKNKSTQISPPQVRRNNPAFPARWLYGFLRALSGDRALLSPSLANHLRQLDASVEAPRPHDFAVRSIVTRQLTICVHRIPRPTFVTIAKRPLCRGNLAEHANGRLSQ